MLRLIVIALSIFSVQVDATEQQSECFGTTGNGALTNGVKLPVVGKNFVSYSQVADALGRTYVHTEVRKIVLQAYRSLEKELPDKVYKYAETGFKNGGQFKPHKTHQNGLSIDFMTPVVNSAGQSVHLPTHALNRYGYDIEFDSDGTYKNYRIDYSALAAHLVALHKASIAQGHDLWRVIFDPKFQSGLFNTQYGDYIRKNIQLSTKRSWVRHDEHYHVDFAVSCKKLLN